MRISSLVGSGFVGPYTIAALVESMANNRIEGTNFLPRSRAKTLRVESQAPLCLVNCLKALILS